LATLLLLLTSPGRLFPRGKVPNTVRQILIPTATEPDSASTRRRQSSSRQWPRSTARATSSRTLAMSIRMAATIIPPIPGRITTWKNMPRSSKGGSAWKMMTSWCTTKTVVLNASPTTVRLRVSAIWGFAVSTASV
jgi:hypothetical protein